MSDIRGVLTRNRILAVVLVFLLVLTGYLYRLDIQEQGRNFAEYLRNKFDKRPVKRILFIGNSRTYWHDMPAMVKKMARNPYAPFRYYIAVHAQPATYLYDHYDNPAVHELLSESWDYVVLQGGSPENSYPEGSRRFIENGRALIKKIQAMHQQPFLFAGWVYEGNSYEQENKYLYEYHEKYKSDYLAYIKKYHKLPDDQPAPESFYPLNAQKHYALIQRDYQQLASETKTAIVNAGEAFEYLRTSNLYFSHLTEDGNHPTLQGSYLVAVMFHVCFSDQEAQEIQYRPPGLLLHEGRMIRAIVDQFYPFGTCSGRK